MKSLPSMAGLPGEVVKPGKKMTYNRKTWVRHNKEEGHVYKHESWVVRVMAVAEGYAMVRRPHAMPYVCALSDLTEI